MVGSGSVRLGYAAGEQGRGVVYARILQADAVSVVRATFRIEAKHSHDSLVLGLEAVGAIAPALRKRVRAVDLHVEDGLASALTGRREIPAQLFLAYVRARCALNAFARCTVRQGEGERDLVARAIAEVSLRVAA